MIGTISGAEDAVVPVLIHPTFQWRRESKEMVIYGKECYANTSSTTRIEKLSPDLAKQSLLVTLRSVASVVFWEKIWTGAHSRQNETDCKEDTQEEENVLLRSFSIKKKKKWE